MAIRFHTLIVATAINNRTISVSSKQWVRSVHTASGTPAPAIRVADSVNASAVRSRLVNMPAASRPADNFQPSLCLALGAGVPSVHVQAVCAPVQLRGSNLDQLQQARLHIARPHVPLQSQLGLEGGWVHIPDRQPFLGRHHCYSLPDESLVLLEFLDFGRLVGLVGCRLGAQGPRGMAR
jgi:hypothetical protein